MKTYPQPTRSLACTAAIVELPPRGQRPVRRGNFWPGESFGTFTNKWDLTGAFANQAYVLPTLRGHHGPQTF